MRSEPRLGWKTLSALGLLVLAVSSGCGGRVGSQSESAPQAAIAVSQLVVVGASAAVSVEEPVLTEGPVVPLTTDAERSAATRALVLQELDALRQKLPKDANLTFHRDTLQALPAP